MFRHRIFSQEYWDKNKDSIKEFAKEYEKYENCEPSVEVRTKPNLKPAPAQVASVIIESRKQRLPEVIGAHSESAADSTRRRKHS